MPMPILRGGAARLLGNSFIGLLGKNAADTAKKAADDAIAFGPNNSVGKMFSSIVKEMMSERKTMTLSSKLDGIMVSFSKGEIDKKAFMRIFYKVNGQKLKKFKKSYNSSDSLFGHDNLRKIVLNSLMSIFDHRFPSSERLNALAYLYSEFSPMLAKMELPSIKHPKDWFFNKTMIWALNNCVNDALKSQNKEEVLKKLQKIVRTKAELYNSVSYEGLMGRSVTDEYVLLTAARLLEFNIENKKAFDIITELFAQKSSKLMDTDKLDSRTIDQFRSIMQRYEEIHGVSMQSNPKFVLSSNNILFAIVPELMHTPLDSGLDISRNFLFGKSTRWQNKTITISQDAEDVHFLIKAMLFESKNKSSIDSVHRIFEEVREALTEGIQKDELSKNKTLSELMYKIPEFAEWVNGIRYSP